MIYVYGKTLLCIVFMNKKEEIIVWGKNILVKVGVKMVFLALKINTINVRRTKTTPTA